MISAKRRGFAMLAVFAIMVSACGGATPSGSPASVAPGGSAASVAPSGGASGDFTFVVDSEPTTLAGPPDDLPTSWITQMIYSTLYQPDYKLVYQPLAADGQPEISATVTDRAEHDPIALRSERGVLIASRPAGELSERAGRIHPHR